jgi:hypothetical protein
MPELRRSLSRSNSRDANGALSAGAGLSEERTALDPGKATLSAPADGPQLLGGADFPEPRQRGIGKFGGRSPARASAQEAKTSSHTHGMPWVGPARLSCLRWPPWRTSRKHAPLIQRERASRPERTARCSAPRR